MKQSTPLVSIPTHIITGFLGSGKTTAILHLLKAKPAYERWAILVNEFGEIGIDGSILQAQSTSVGSVFIREVPGGCMCCTSGVPMKLALNQLLTQARPDRLFIEPTGLGHPKEVLKSLQNEYYQDVLAIQKVVTLVDASKLSDARYTTHSTFNEQISIADIIVGNKFDLYESEDAQRLIEYVATAGIDPKYVQFTRRGELELSAIEGARVKSIQDENNIEHAHRATFLSDIASPKITNDFQPKVHNDDGFVSIGWQFESHYCFQRDYILNWAKSLLTDKSVERFKAVIHTDDGCYAINATTNDFNETLIEECPDSRVEIIASAINSHWKDELMAGRTEIYRRSK